MNTAREQLSHMDEARCTDHVHVTAYTFTDANGRGWEHQACVYCTAGYDVPIMDGGR